MQKTKLLLTQAWERLKNLYTPHNVNESDCLNMVIEALKISNEILELQNKRISELENDLDVLYQSR